MPSYKPCAHIKMTGRPTWKSADGKSWKRSRRYGGEIQGDPRGRPRGINLSREVKQEAERSVGAREDDVGLGGPLGSPAGWGGSRAFARCEPDEQGRGRRKRPNPTSSSTPAPTDVDGLFLG